MKNKVIFVLMLIALKSTGYSQICESSLHPMSNDVKLSAIPKKTVGNIDMLAVAKEDKADNIPGKVPQFGHPFEVDFNLNNSGNWTTLDNGDRLWLLSIECPEAKSINLLYDKYWLPEGATLHIYNKNKSQTSCMAVGQNVVDLMIMVDLTGMERYILHGTDQLPKED